MIKLKTFVLPWVLDLGRSTINDWPETKEARSQSALTWEYANMKLWACEKWEVHPVKPGTDRAPGIISSAHKQDSKSFSCFHRITASFPNGEIERVQGFMFKDKTWTKQGVFPAHISVKLPAARGLAISSVWDLALVRKYWHLYRYSWIFCRGTKHPHRFVWFWHYAQCPACLVITRVEFFR